MRFAICDDEPVFLLIQETLIKHYLEVNNYEIYVDTFSSPYDLLSLIESSRANPYQVISPYFDVRVDTSLI